MFSGIELGWNDEKINCNLNYEHLTEQMENIPKPTGKFNLTRADKSREFVYLDNNMIFWCLIRSGTIIRFYMSN